MAMETQGINVESSSPISQPNATLYISNVDWKIKKAVLKRALLSLLCRHGKVLDIICLRREGLRGQAWVIFDDISSATSALRSENGFMFFGKELKIAYSNEKSDRIAKRDGTFVPKDRRVKRRAQVLQQGDAKRMKVEENLNGANSDGNGSNGKGSFVIKQEDEDQQLNNESDSVTTGNILFAQNLPSDCNEMMLAMLFRPYTGYKEVRFPRKGLAFIEFDDEPHATLALKGLNGFRLNPKDSLVLQYAAKKE